MVFFSMCEFFTQAALDNASRHGFEDETFPTCSPLTLHLYASNPNTVAFFWQHNVCGANCCFFLRALQDSRGRLGLGYYI